MNNDNLDLCCMEALSSGLNPNQKCMACIEKVLYSFGYGPVRVVLDAVNDGVICIGRNPDLRISDGTPKHTNTSGRLDDETNVR